MSPNEAPALILCDWAEVLSGKLYIMGAGFSRLLAGQATPSALAILWNIPWERSNIPQNIELSLMTEDGAPFTDDNSEPIKVAGRVEVGRPPGVKPGTSLPAPIALRLPPINFPPGGYRWELLVNGSLEAAVSFEAVGGPL